MNSGDPKESNVSSVWVAVEKAELPKKKYFKIGEVALLVGVEPHVLRYWQTQFPRVRPQKSRSGHRLYRRKDVEILLAIRELLHVQRFTIAGARQALRSLLATGELASQPPRSAAPIAETQTPGRGERDLSSESTRQESLSEPPSGPAAEVEIVGLDAQDLSDVMEAELARHAPKGVVSVDVVPGTEPVDSTVPVNHVEVEIGLETAPNHVLESDPAPTDEAEMRLSDLPQVADPETGSLEAENTIALAGQPQSPDSANGSASEIAASTNLVSDEAVTSQASSQSVVSEPVQGGTESKKAQRQQSHGQQRQLGFGFIPTNKELLLKARQDVLSLLEYLDQEDSLARRRCV
jgi:DNA-binding transcriptional MerR regulator